MVQCSDIYYALYVEKFCALFMTYQNAGNTEKCTFAVEKMIKFTNIIWKKPKVNFNFAFDEYTGIFKHWFLEMKDHFLTLYPVSYEKSYRCSCCSVSVSSKLTFQRGLDTNLKGCTCFISEQKLRLAATWRSAFDFVFEAGNSQGQGRL